MAVISPQQEQEIFGLVCQAGQVLKDHFQRVKAGDKLKIQSKADESKVTEADFQSNEILVAGLQKLFPDDIVVSEEAPTAGESNGTDQRMWLVDPLDGTQSFIEGSTTFSVLVALCRQGEVEFSIIFFPMLDLLAHAEKGRGAFLNAQPLQVATSSTIGPQRLFLRHFPKTQDVRAFPHWIDSMRAVLKLCQGEFDAASIKIKRHSAWDVAAATLIIEESGGKVTDEYGSPLRFEGDKIGFKFFVASNKSVHAEVLKFVLQNHECK